MEKGEWKETLGEWKNGEGSMANIHTGINFFTGIEGNGEDQ